MNISEQADKNLRDFKEVADNIRLPFMLAEGTLLGAYREKNYIKGDEHDIDLMIMEEYFHLVDGLVIRLQKLGFENNKRFRLKEKLEGVALTKGDNHIDIMRMMVDDGICYNFGRYGKKILIYSYPADLFREYREIEFRGMRFKTPADIEKYLIVRYGNWRVAVSKADYNYHDAIAGHSPNVRIWKQ